MIHLKTERTKVMKFRCFKVADVEYQVPGDLAVNVDCVISVSEGGDIQKTYMVVREGDSIEGYYLEEDFHTVVSRLNTIAE